MKVAVFSTHNFEKDYLLGAAATRHELVLLDVPLNSGTAVLAQGCKGVCIFVNDDGSKEVLEKLQTIGVSFLILRSAGFNHVDIQAARKLGLRLARVPEYSPYAVAEHAVALMLALNRRLIKAHSRVRDANFSLDGLIGFDMNEKTAGIIGTGKIGKVVAGILLGFGCRVFAYDPMPDEEWAVKQDVLYTDMNTLCTSCDIITIHSPLTKDNKHFISEKLIASMKKGVMLINTSRGELIQTKDVINGLKSGQIGYLGLDVYENEKNLFFEDHSEEILMDDTIARLMTFPNVLITSHQAFLTDTALQNIADISIANIDAFETSTDCGNEIRA